MVVPGNAQVSGEYNTPGRRTLLLRRPRGCRGTVRLGASSCHVEVANRSERVRGGSSPSSRARALLGRYRAMRDESTVRRADFLCYLPPLPLSQPGADEAPRTPPFDLGAKTGSGSKPSESPLLASGTEGG